MIHVEFPACHPDLTQTFAKVLRDDPDYAARLAQALEEGSHRIAAAHFNGQPVGVAVLNGNHLAWMVVHPATRGRGVAHDFMRLMGEQLGERIALPRQCRGH